MKYLFLLPLLLSCSKPETEPNNSFVPLPDEAIIYTVPKGSVVSFYWDSLGAWDNPAKEAIKAWQGLNTSLSFRMGTKDAHTTFVKFKEGSYAAQAIVANSKGKAGDTIWINPTAKAYYQKYLLMHEIGHVIGLAHIESRPSVMSQRDRIGFTKEDSLLIKNLWK